MLYQGPMSHDDHNPEVAPASGIRRPFLMVLRASSEVVTVSVKAPSITLGRDRDRDVFVDEPTVSRNHAEILRDNEGCRLRDLNSKNGTFVNRRDIGDAPHQLNDGDEIRLGTSFMVLIFRDVADTTGGTSPDQTVQVPLAGTEKAKEEYWQVGRDTKSVVWSSPRPRESGDADEDLGIARNEVYAGTVILKVIDEGDTHSLPQLVETLTRDSRFVLLNVVSDSPRNADISLTLWEPLPLLGVLAGMNNVSKVSPMEEEGGAGGRVEGCGRVISVGLSSGP